MFKNYFLTTLFFLLSFSIRSQVLELDTAIVTPLQISKQVGFFVDTTTSLSLAEASRRTFRPIKTDNFRLPFSDHVYWYRIKLKNTGAQEHTWFLSWNNNTMERIDFYIPHGDGYRQEPGGRLVAESDHTYLGNNPYVAFELTEGQEKTMYIRAMSQRGQRVRLMLYESSVFFEANAKNNGRDDFINGLIVLRLFYVVLLALFAVRERIFRAYSAMIVIRSVGFWGLVGDLGGFFPVDPYVALLINFNAYHFVPIAYIIAVRVLLPIHRFPAFVRYVLDGISAVVVVLSVVIALNYRWYWLLASTWMVLLTQVVVLGLYAWSIARKYSIDWYYSIPLLMGLVSYFFWQMSLLGILNAPWVFRTSTFLFISEIFIFGLFLGKIIRNYERARNVSQQQLALSEAQAANLKELDALKTNFFANISHEFRTPLTLLTGPLADLKSRYPQEKMIPVMQRNVRRLQVLTNQFVDLARIESGKVRPDLVRGDVAWFLRPLFASFESLAQSRGILFHYQQNLEEKEAIFDPDKLEKIITNLLSNAFKFTPENGRVEVDIVYSADDMLIRVKDTGIGIGKEQLPYVFDRFYQAETTVRTGEEGSGIGLSLVRELVELLRGKIRVESQPHQGSTFIVQLPIDAASWTGDDDPDELSDTGLTPFTTTTLESTLPTLHEPVATLNPSDPDAPVLLLVEDNADLRAYIRSIFDTTYHIVEATNGQEGLDKTFAHIPDLIICDVMMPQLNGLEFCKTIKGDARSSHIPIIILSAKATLDDRLEGLELGANDYLSKPFARAELELRVQNLLKQRDVLRQKYSQQLASSGVRVAPAETLDEKFLNRAIRVVEEYGDDSEFGIAELCEALNVSRSNLHRKLKALTNQSTSEFIRSIRIYRAAELLKDPTLSVSEVGYRVGFQSVSYFSRSFSEQMGTSPTEWAASHAL